MTELRVLLDDEARARIDDGEFVRVQLGAWLETGGVRTRSLLVGRASGALRVYANVCRHQAVPLDLTGSPMSDDKLHLLCNSHGALYRPSDGYCVTGPCRGQSLVAVAARAIDERTITVTW